MHVLVQGGGRWGRVIVSVLMNRLGSGDKISWLTRRSASGVRALVASSGWSRAEGSASSLPFLDVVERESAVTGAVDAAIVATAPRDHEADLTALVARFAPSAVLVEKPFAPNLQAAASMLETAARHGTRIFVNFEFRLASYIGAARSALNGLRPATISIDWGDAAVEVRPDGPKAAEWGTHIAQDQGSHVWSLLDRLLPGHDWRIADVDLSPLPDHLALTLRGEPLDKERSDCVEGFVRLSRRAPGRRRKIQVTTVDDQELSLDFADEPGQLKVNGVFVDTDEDWESLPRPLSSALDVLVKTAEGTVVEGSDLISAERCIAAVSFAAAAEQACHSAARLLTEGAVDLSQTITAAMIDSLVPTIAALGLRMDLSQPGSEDRLAKLLWSLRAIP